MNNATMQGEHQPSTVLTVYFSHSGNTRAAARLIQQQVGGDLVEIVPATPYPRQYNDVVNQAKKEIESGYLPPLETVVENIATYDVILVGSPNWWNTVAPPIMTFLSAGDFSGKRIAPFITHEGTGLGRSCKDVAILCPGSIILDGFALRAGGEKGAEKKIEEWLRELGVAK